MREITPDPLTGDTIVAYLLEPPDFVMYFFQVYSVLFQYLMQYSVTDVNNNITCGVVAKVQKIQSYFCYGNPVLAKMIEF